MSARDAIKSLLERPIAFHPALARLAGSVNAGLMLSQALYWSDRTKDEGGWFYKVHTDWSAEICLSRDEQRTARDKLRQCGFWHEETRGLPKKLFFRVDTDALARALAYGEIPTTDGGSAPSGVQKPPTDGGKPATDGEIPAANKEAETTQRLLAETTTNTVSATASAAPTVVLIPLNNHTETHPSEAHISEAEVAEWRELYPAVDVMQELRKMRGWALANPRNRKTASGILRFIHRWLSKAQDEAKVSDGSRQSRANEGVRREIPIAHNDAATWEEWLRHAGVAHRCEAKDGLGRAAWATVVAGLEKAINPHSFETWIKPLRYLCTSAEGVLFVGCPTEDFQALGDRYGPEMQRVLKTLQGISDVTLIA